MVKYNNIIKAIDEYIKKCYTIEEIKIRLEELDKESINYDSPFFEPHFDRWQSLRQLGLLNPLEERDFDRIFKYQKGESRDEALFKYERRLVEGIKMNEPPIIDKDIFEVDSQIGYIGTENDLSYLESKQIESERDFLEGVDDKVIRSVDEYYSGGLQSLNDKLKLTNKELQLKESEINGYIKHFEEEKRKYVKDIDYVINNNEGLIGNTVLYRGGELDDFSMKVGDHRKFKSYTSTSFQEDVGTYWRGKGNVWRFLYKIYAPKGTKGICANNNKFGNKYKDEHEYLLARNTGYTVLDIDYDNRIIEIVLDEP